MREQDQRNASHLFPMGGKVGAGVLIIWVYHLVASRLPMMTHPVERPEASAAFTKAVQNIFVHDPLDAVGIKQSKRKTDHCTLFSLSLGRRPTVRTPQLRTMRAGAASYAEDQQKC